MVEIESARSREMREVIAQWRASGKSAIDFGARYGHSKTTLWYWRRRFRALDRSAKRVDSAFIEVDVVDDKAETATSFRVALNRSREIEVAIGFDGDELRRLVEVLESC